MTLKEELKPIIGNRRRFMLYRIADVDTDTARKLCGIKKGTYNSWLQDETFVAIHRRRDEFAQDYRKEAIQMLRRDNQLAAVMLEGKIILKMKAEIDSGEYNLLKTHIAREVYSKLIADLDVVPQAPTISWEQRLQQIFLNSEQPPVLPEGGTVEGEFIESNHTVEE